MNAIKLGTITNVDTNTNTCEVKLLDGGYLRQVNYSFPYYSHTDNFGFVFVPIEGMTVLVTCVDNHYYISGYVLPFGKKPDIPILPGDMMFILNKFAFLHLSASGIISGQSSPACGFTFYPDLSKLELFLERFQSTTALGGIKIDTDRYGAFLEINFTDIDNAIQGGNIITVNIESLKQKLFALKIDRSGKFDLTLFNLIKITMDRSGNVNIKSSKLSIDCPLISLGSSSAREPAVLGLQLQSLLTELSAIILSMTGGLTNPQIASSASAQLAQWNLKLASMFAKKVRLE